MKKIVLFIAVILTLAFSCIFFGCTKDPNEQFDDDTKYVIDIFLDDDNNILICNQNFTFYNYTESILSELVFNLYPNAYSQNNISMVCNESELSTYYPNGLSYGGIDIENVTIGDVSVASFDDSGHFLFVPIDELMPDESISLDIKYSVTLPQTKLRMGYYDNVYKIANFYPQLCVYDDGFVMNEYTPIGDPFYSDTADYTIKLTMPNTYKIFGTGESEYKHSGNGLVIYHFNAQNVRDVAFVASEQYNVLSTVYDGVTINYASQVEEKLQEKLNIARDSIEIFSNAFGAYPYKTYSVVDVSFSEGGMEYPMLSFISNTLSSDLIEEVIVHETAHQWWYSAVGSNQIDYSWQDEGLAEFSTLYYYQKTTGKDVINKAVSTSYRAYSAYMDKNNTQIQPMNKSLSDFYSEQEYYYTAYVEGMLLYANLYQIMGETKFINALQHYYKTYIFENATPLDLVDSFSTINDYDTLSIIEAWTEGKIVIIPASETT